MHKTYVATLTTGGLLLQQHLLDAPISCDPRGPFLLRCDIKSPTVLADITLRDGIPRSMAAFYRTTDPEPGCSYANDVVAEDIADGKVGVITKFRRLCEGHTGEALPPPGYAILVLRRGLVMPSHKDRPSVL